MTSGNSMSIYEYQCDGCHRTHEVWQKIMDKPLKNCPDCNGLLHKLLSLSSFQLKGGGWYVDGYSSIQNNTPKSNESIDLKDSVGNVGGD